jgi:hypothetical protein
MSVPAIDSQISTAPAVAPARIERIALACRKLDIYYHLTCLIYTFFFSVVVVAISSRCPETGVCCSLESCVLELRAGADDYDVQIVEDPIAAALVQKTSRKEKTTKRNCYAQSISRQNDWRHSQADSGEQHFGRGRGSRRRQALMSRSWGLRFEKLPS